MKWAMLLVGAAGLLAFGVFMAVISYVIGRPAGDDSGEVFVRAVLDVTWWGGLALAVLAVFLMVIAIPGMRRTERERRAEKGHEHDPADSL